MNEYQIVRSRALEPLFFRAPHPPNMVARPYQHAGVEYALARQHCLLGDAPGVGKTAQAILISNAIGAKRTLVVCPASLRGNWEEEVWKWSTIPNVSSYVVGKASKGISNLHAYNIISYDLLRNPAIMAALRPIPWDHAILDEAHAIKDPDSKRTRAIMELVPEIAGRITLLSGTPMPNGPREVYNAARLLDWSSIDHMSLFAFTQHYYGEGGGMIRSPVWDEKLQAKVNKVHWSEEVRNQPRHLDELQNRLRGSFMIRRLKADVLPQLPPKQFHLVPLALTPDLKVALAHPGWKQVASLMELDPEGFAAGASVDGAVATARRMLGEAKAAPTCGYIEELLREGVQKIVIAAHHTSVLEAARTRLAKHGLLFMDGRTPPGQRQAIVHKFQNDPKIPLILGQTQVIGEGHTLAVAQDIVAMEGDWVPGKLEQLVDRIHRIGQEGSYVQAHIPVVPGSLDERIMSTVVVKAKDIHKALDGGI